MLLAAPGLQAATGSAWVAIDLPLGQEKAAVETLEAAGIVTLSWSTAVAEVSGFDAVELRTLAAIEASLTDGDPRRDPWLEQLKPHFLPRSETARLWVETGSAAEAHRLLDTGSGPSVEVPEPRRITGWMVVAFSALYLTFRLWATLIPGPPPPAREWLWLPLVLVVLVGGVFLIGVRPGATVAPPRVEASWLQHLWFQRSWPYGATWDDWTPGKAWTYSGYERREGRIVEVSTALETPDAAWVEQAYSGLDPRHAARLFPPENP